MISLWTTPVEAGQPVGFLDYTDGHTVYGWAWNPDVPDSAAEVQVTVKNKEDGALVFTQTCPADRYREDLTHIGNSCHAFAADLNLSEFSSIPRGSYIIEASCQGIPLKGTLYWQGGSFPIQAEETKPAESPDGPLGPPNTNRASLASCSHGNTNRASLALCSYENQTVDENAASTEYTTPQPISLGVFRITAYCSCRRCSGRWGRLTSSGTTAVSGHTAAVDPNVIPFGTKLMIDGITYIAEDEGSGVNGRHIDIYCDSHAEAAAFGLQHKEVFFVP